MSKPWDVEVLLPIAPDSPYLEETLMSLLSQSYTDFKLLAILDSDDFTNEALLRRIIPSGVLKIITVNPEYNLSQKLNAGIRASTARFLARADADDKYHADRLKIQRNYLLNIESNISLVGTNALAIDENGEFLFRLSTPVVNESVNRKMLWRNPMLHPSVFGYREIFEEFFYRDEMNISQDYDLWLRIATKYKLSNIPKELLFYRVHSGNASRRRISWREIIQIHRSRTAFARSQQVSFLLRMSATIIWSFKNIAVPPLFFLKLKIAVRKHK